MSSSYAILISLNYMLPNTAISQQIARSIQFKKRQYNVIIMTENAYNLENFFCQRAKKRQTKTKQERKAKEIAFSKYATPLSFNFTD